MNPLFLNAIMNAVRSELINSWWLNPSAAIKKADNSYEFVIDDGPRRVRVNILSNLSCIVSDEKNCFRTVLDDLIEDILLFIKGEKPKRQTTNYMRDAY